MLAVRNQIVSVAVVVAVLALPGFLAAQHAKNLETRNVPIEARARLELYFDLLQKEDWARLYEIEDWPEVDKNDYIANHIRFKGNTYESVSKILQIGLRSSMTYDSKQKKWGIEGCGIFRDNKGFDITAYGTVSISNNPERGWIVLSFIPSLFVDGWRQCKMPIEEFPIRILDK